MSALNNETAVKTQYASSANLSTRISIHAKYSTNKQGFGNWIAAHYPVSAGMSVLELGCGTGAAWLNQREIIDACSRITLTDFSEGMLTKTKGTLKQYSTIEYAVVDIQNIPYADQSFDMIIANMMLYHVPDIPRALSEVRRVLRKGGTFCCATYGENGIMEYLAGLFQNTGIGLDSWPLRVYIAKNSVGMVDDKGVRRPMAPLSQAQQILMGALAAGYGNKPDIQDAMAYLTHLQNVLAKNAMGAYVAEAAKAHIISPSEGDDGA